MIFIDVQGTLIKDSDKSLINGAGELLRFLNSQKIPYVVITNNTKFKSEDFLKELRRKGLEIKDGAYLDPFCVLKNILPICKAAPFGSKKFKDVMGELGYEIETSNSAKAVLVASGDDFKFDEFATMIEILQNGAELIAMSETSVYKKNDRSYPGVGAIAKMLNYATGREYNVIGKPSVKFYEEALGLLNLQGANAKFSDVLIISDDAKGDLVGAKELGMRTALVLSGKVSDASKTGVEPKFIDEIYEDVSVFLKELDAKHK